MNITKVKAKPNVMAISVSDKSGMDDYKASDDIRTLMMAKEIKDDKQRFDAAMKKLDEKIAQMKAVKGGLAMGNGMDEDLDQNLDQGE